MARSGGGRTPSLDPFGTSAGGLGRYNVSGQTIQSLADFEAYAVATAWANGQASNAEYIASLQKLKDLATPGTREFVTADNRLSDAVYTIGRNKITADVNAAITPAARIAALNRMQAYDTARLGTMTSVDSQAYREQQDRIAGAGVDIRQATYSELVDKVNRGQAGTTALLTLARTLQTQAGAGPDADEWDSTVKSLVERVADEKMADGFQSYQHHRKTGASLLADIDKRLAQLDPSSPAYKDLNRQREDLAQRVKDEGAALHDATVQGQRSAGTISDAKYLADLKRQYVEATPGTTDAINAGNRLHDATFSLAEDKLRYDVQHKKRPVGDLIRFYTTYQRTMQPGSERYRQLQGAIDTLKAGHGLASGGGGGSSKSKGIALGPKLIGGQAVIGDLLPGGRKAPPGFLDLLHVDITNTAAKHWWDNNLRSMVDSNSDGRATWTYYDKRGNTYEMPFLPSMMAQMDGLNLGYIHSGLAGAKSAKDAQTWVGRLISATNVARSRNASLTMDVYTKNFAAIERAKQQALAGGRYGEYSNLVREQQQLTRFILGIPDGAPTDVANATNPYLTSDQKGRIGSDLGKLAPLNNDETSPYYNPTGDAALGMIQSGAITTQVDPVTGDILNAQLDPNRGYVSQHEDGTIGITPLDEVLHPEQFRLDPNTGDSVPVYRDQMVQVRVRYNGEDVAVWQPVINPGTKGAGKMAFVYTIDRGGITAGRPAGSAGPGTPGTNRQAGYRPIIDPTTHQLGQLELYTTYTIEKGKKVGWISTDKQTWIRYLGSESVSPRLVVNEGVSLNADGKWEMGGKVLEPAEMLGAGGAHVWGSMDAVNAGAVDDGQWGVGAPGTQFTMRKPGLDGSLDFRPDYVINSEEDRALFQQARRGNRKLTTAAATVTVDQQRRNRSFGPADSPTHPHGLLGTEAAMRFGGELLDKALRFATATKLGPLGIGDNAHDLGPKPVPAAVLRPPIVPTLADVPASDGRLMSTPLAPLKPLKLTLPPLKLPAQKGPTSAAAAAAAAKKLPTPVLNPISTTKAHESTNRVGGT